MRPNIEQSGRRGKREQERGRGARHAWVNQKNWARTNWDGKAENKTRRKGEWGVAGVVWGGSHQ